MAKIIEFDDYKCGRFEKKYNIYKCIEDAWDEKEPVASSNDLKFAEGLAKRIGGLVILNPESDTLSGAIIYDNTEGKHWRLEL